MPVELFWWAVAVGRGPELTFCIYDGWDGAAEVVDNDLGEAAWRGFTTKVEAVSYLRAFASRIDYLDTMVERVAGLTAELHWQGQVARLTAGVTDEEMDALESEARTLEFCMACQRFS